LGWKADPTDQSADDDRALLSGHHQQRGLVRAPLYFRSRRGINGMKPAPQRESAGPFVVAPLITDPTWVCRCRRIARIEA
jgi:hypothetical protein